MLPKISDLHGLEQVQVWTSLVPALLLKTAHMPI